MKRIIIPEPSGECIILPISELPDEDMQNVPKALARAAKRAKELARQTRTKFVVMHNGKLIREIPPPEDKEENKRDGD